MLLCTPLAFYLPSCSFSGLSRKLPPSPFSFLLVSFTSLSLWMGTIFQIVSSALCYFSHRNYLPSLILWNARGFLSLFKPLRKALKHCPRSSGPLHPPPHQWLLRYSLWHCRTQPPSVRNAPPLSPNRGSTESTIEVWMILREVTEIQEFNILQKFGILKVWTQTSMISVDGAYIFKLNPEGI